jgi:hypothetical protein
VPVVVGLAAALLALLIFLSAVANGEASIAQDWKLAALIVGVALGIGWAGAHIIARVVADRRRAVILGVLLFVAMGLCPPWVYTFSPSGAATTTRPAGYHLLFDPPAPDSGSSRAGVRIDILRLTIQWAVLAALFGLAFALRDARRGDGG